jgi:hypothetical protein
MGSLPFALSVHKFVSSVGADAGFASIIGLAILVLLYFAQARETASLRDRVEETEQRNVALEQRVALLQRNQGSAGPATGPAAVSEPVAVQGASGRPAAAAAPMGSTVASLKRPATQLRLPGAPAGVAAPALAAATKLIPTLPPAPAGSAPAPVAAAGVGDAPGGNPDDTLFVRPATAAGANGHGQGAAVAPPPVFAGAAAGGQAAVASTPTQAHTTLPPRLQVRPEPLGGRGSGPRSPLQSSRLVPARERSLLARRLVPVLIALGALAAVVVALIVITSSGGSGRAAARNPARGATHHGRGSAASSAAPAPGSVTVAVLNGTAVTNLAHDVAQRLALSGYKEGTIATAADQTHATTLVGYLPGHRADALVVAKALGLPATRVAPADSQATGVACSAPAGSNACAADVIVTVGTDLAAAAGGATTT